MPTLVELVPYDQEWPQHFSAAAEWLRELLKDKVVAIDHFGSTSIPGMHAKPLIDIDVTLADLDAIPTASALLAVAVSRRAENRFRDDMWAFLLKTGTPALRVFSARLKTKRIESACSSATICGNVPTSLRNTPS